MSIEKKKINEYLNKTKFIVLATVNEGKAPIQRSLGSFAAEDFTVYFSTNKNAAKVEQIKHNSRVSILFQHENQELTSFQNVAIVGEAKEITVKEERNKAITLFGNRNPGFKDKAENAIFRVEPKEIKILDYSKGFGPEAIQIINV
ncbi:MAG: pyridoxamine 5'-phosphate oxidase family protein [Ruminiclostridium sp.]